jgi:hypothetical protein
MTANPDGSGLRVLVTGATYQVRHRPGLPRHDPRGRMTDKAGYRGTRGQIDGGHDNRREQARQLTLAAGTAGVASRPGPGPTKLPAA